MNPIIEAISKNRPNYCHVLEIETLEDLKNAIETIYDEFIRIYDLNTIIDFFNTLTVYCLDDNNETEINEFNIENFVTNL